MARKFKTACGVDASSDPFIQRVGQRGLGPEGGVHAGVLGNPHPAYLVPVVHPHHRLGDSFN